MRDIESNLVEPRPAYASQLILLSELVRNVFSFRAVPYCSTTDLAAYAALSWSFAALHIMQIVSG